MDAQEAYFFQMCKLFGQDAQATEFVDGVLRERRPECLRMAIMFASREEDMQVSIVAFYFIGNWFTPTILRPEPEVRKEFRNFDQSLKESLLNALFRGLTFSSIPVRQAAAKVLSLLCNIDFTRKIQRLVMTRIGEMAESGDANTQLAVMTVLCEMFSCVRHIANFIVVPAQTLACKMCIGAFSSDSSVEAKSLALECVGKVLKASENASSEVLMEVLNVVLKALGNVELLTCDAYAKSATQLLSFLLRSCHDGLSSEIMTEVCRVLVQKVNEYYFDCAMSVFGKLADFEAFRCVEAPQFTGVCANALDGVLVDAIASAGFESLLEENTGVNPANSAFECLVAFGVACPEQVCKDLIPRYAEFLSTNRIGLALSIARIFVAIESRRPLCLTEFWQEHLTHFCELATHADELVRISEFTLVREMFENHNNTSYTPILAALLDDSNSFQTFIRAIASGSEMGFRTCHHAVKLWLSICSVFDPDLQNSLLGALFDDMFRLFEQIRQKDFITQEPLLEDLYDTFGMMILQSPISSSPHISEVAFTQIQQLSQMIATSGNPARLCNCLAILVVAFSQRFEAAKNASIDTLMSILMPILEHTREDTLLLSIGEVLHNAPAEATSRYVQPSLAIVEAALSSGEGASTIKGVCLIIVSLFRSQGVQLEAVAAVTLQLLCNCLVSERTLSVAFEWLLKAINGILSTSGAPAQAIEGVITVVNNVTKHLEHIHRIDSDSCPAVVTELMNVWFTVLQFADASVVSRDITNILALPSFLSSAEISEMDALVSSLRLLGELCSRFPAVAIPAVHGHIGISRLLDICRASPELSNSPVLAFVAQS